MRIYDRDELADVLDAHFNAYYGLNFDTYDFDQLERKLMVKSRNKNDEPWFVTLQSEGIKPYTMIGHIGGATSVTPEPDGAVVVFNDYEKYRRRYITEYRIRFEPEDFTLTMECLDSNIRFNWFMEDMADLRSHVNFNQMCEIAEVEPSATDEEIAQSFAVTYDAVYFYNPVIDELANAKIHINYTIEDGVITIDSGLYSAQGNAIPMSQHRTDVKPNNNVITDRWKANEPGGQRVQFTTDYRKRGFNYRFLHATKPEDLSQLLVRVTGVVYSTNNIPVGFKKDLIIDATGQLPLFNYTGE